MPVWILIFRDDNIIEGCREIPVSIQAHGGSREVLPAGAHRNISIAGNRVFNSVLPNLYVTSTEGLRLQGNQWMKTVEGQKEAVVLEKCGSVLQ